jgi:TPR repeat protein
LLYANGKGTEQDLPRAYVLLHDSAKSLPMAQEALELLETKLSKGQKEQAQKAIAKGEAKRTD